MVAKAEHLAKGSNPRFVVTSLAEIDARSLYEDIYCARGEMENRLEEQQLDLFADRSSAATMRANQLRLWFASFAHVLLEALRRIGLRRTSFANATCGTIRLKRAGLLPHSSPVTSKIDDDGVLDQAVVADMTPRKRRHGHAQPSGSSRRTSRAWKRGATSCGRL